MPNQSKEKEALITQEYLKSILEYNPETGIFTWLKLAKNVHTMHIGDIAGCFDSNGYITIQINKKQYKAHRLAWLYETGNWPEYDIDHIDGITVPNFNKFSNLRDTDKNNWNTRELIQSNTSGFRGVSWVDRDNRYLAHIQINGKGKYLGHFLTLEEASKAYEAAKLIYHKIPVDNS